MQDVHAYLQTLVTGTLNNGQYVWRNASHMNKTKGTDCMCKCRMCVEMCA